MQRLRSCFKLQATLARPGGDVAVTCDSSKHHPRFMNSNAKALPTLAPLPALHHCPRSPMLGNWAYLRGCSLDCVLDRNLRSIRVHWTMWGLLHAKETRFEEAWHKSKPPLRGHERGAPEGWLTRCPRRSLRRLGPLAAQVSTPVPSPVPLHQSLHTTKVQPTGACLATKETQKLWT